MEIKRISVFPFKSLKGIDVPSCKIDEHGLQHDRVYMLAYRKRSGEWSAITQRQEPSLARISTELKGDKLVLKHKDTHVELPLDPHQFSDAPTVEMELWSYSMVCSNVISLIPGVHEFFSNFFGDIDGGLADTLNETKVDGLIPELAVLVSQTRRVVPQTLLKNKITSSFQDLWPGSLMTTASYEDLERHVSVMSEEADISMESFRMNLLVDTDEPWIEDDWKELKIGDYKWIAYEPCERCPMPAVDQDKGEFRKGRHPLPSLNRFRVLKAGRTPCFGLNLLNTGCGSVKVGDKVQVLSEV